MHSNSVVRKSWFQEVSTMWQQVLSMGERIFSEDRMAGIALGTFNLLLIGLILVSLYHAFENGTVVGPGQF